MARILLVGKPQAMKHDQMVQKGHEVTVATTFNDVVHVVKKTGEKKAYFGAIHYDMDVSEMYADLLRHIRKYHPYAKIFVYADDDVLRAYKKDIQDAGAKEIPIVHGPRDSAHADAAGACTMRSHGLSSEKSLLVIEK